VDIIFELEELAVVNDPRFAVDILMLSDIVPEILAFPVHRLHCYILVVYQCRIYLETNLEIIIAMAADDDLT